LMSIDVMHHRKTEKEGSNSSTVLNSPSYSAKIVGSPISTASSPFETE